MRVNSKSNVVKPIAKTGGSAHWWKNSREKGRMENLRISNVYVEIPTTKPDAEYEYESPTEDMPRNIAPASIGLARCNDL